MATLALEEVEGARIVGLGSGNTVAHFVRALGHYASSKAVEISVIPSSLQIQLEAEKAGLPIASSALIPKIDVAIDGADQIDKNFHMIKGGGGAILKERIILESSPRRVILADESKFVDALHRPVPIEVIPFGLTFMMKRIQEELKGKAKLRLLEKGYPVYTENGNLILDIDFGPIQDPMSKESALKGLPGVVGVGLFTLAVNTFYKALTNGSVHVIRPRKQL